MWHQNSIFQPISELIFFTYFSDSTKKTVTFVDSEISSDELSRQLTSNLSELISNSILLRFYK